MLEHRCRAVHGLRVSVAEAGAAVVFRLSALLGVLVVAGVLVAVVRRRVVLPNCNHRSSNGLSRSPPGAAKLPGGLLHVVTTSTSGHSHPADDAEAGPPGTVITGERASPSGRCHGRTVPSPNRVRHRHCSDASRAAVRPGGAHAADLPERKGWPRGRSPELPHEQVRRRRPLPGRHGDGDSHPVISNHSVEFSNNCRFRRALFTEALRALQQVKPVAPMFQGARS